MNKILYKKIYKLFYYRQRQSNNCYIILVFILNNNMKYVYAGKICE